MEKIEPPKWSKEYYNLTHLGELSDRRRVTVERFSKGAELTLWLRGESNPEKRWLKSVEAAKLAGEKWIKNGNNI